MIVEESKEENDYSISESGSESDSDYKSNIKVMSQNKKENKEL